jgi:hypothetical protein
MGFEKRWAGSAFGTPVEGKAILYLIDFLLSNGKDHLIRYWDGVPKRNCLVLRLYR